MLEIRATIAAPPTEFAADAPVPSPNESAPRLTRLGERPPQRQE
jgi:hypothetical protein